MIAKHGGNLNEAIKLYGGKKDEWIDLSTGINPNPYPFRDINIFELRDLPNDEDLQKLKSISKTYFNTSASVAVTPGAQAGINILPTLFKDKSISILGTTYNEYKNVFYNSNIKTKSSNKLNNLIGSEVGILCNPNNPTGKKYSKKELFEISKKFEVLVVDESFIDPIPDNSLCSMIDYRTENILILRSFGKFFGLAGLRLGFTVTGEKLNRKIKTLMGPWPISNIAINIGIHALEDTSWIKKTISKLRESTCFLEKLSSEIGWVEIGGTYLFKLYKTKNAKIYQHELAKQKIWTRRFSYSKEWLRLGIPNPKHFSRLGKVFKTLS